MDDSDEACGSYLYRVPDSENKPFVVDIGCDSVVDVSVTNGNNVGVLSQKTIPTNISNTKFCIYKPCLPLQEPNTNICSLAESFIEKTLHQQFDFELSSKAEAQFAKFRTHNSKIIHQTLYNLRQTSQVHSLDKFLKETLPSLEGKSQFQQLRSGKFFRNLYYEEMISSFISDVPKDLLMRYLDESMFHDYHDHCDNYNLRNCVVSLCESNRMFLICPSGPTMSDLCVKEIYPSSYTEEMKLLECKTATRYELNFKIEEIQQVAGATLLVKGEYHVVLCTLTITSDEVCIHLLAKFQFDELVQCATVNPFCSEEMIVATSDGSVTVIHGNSEYQRKICDGLFEDVKWRSCLYGTAQQTVLISDEKNVTLHDFRVPDTKVLKYLELPSEYLNRLENLSPVLLWNPRNCYQYFVTSDQSVIVNDERYMHTPVLKMNHYMHSSPRFGHFTSLENNSYLFSIASYSRPEVVSMQLCQNGPVFDCNKNVRNDSGSLITMREPLWKFSHYNDWATYGSDWKISLSNTCCRLNQPLSGFSIFQVPAVTKANRKCYGLVQQTVVGDLFSQVFEYKDASDSNNHISRDFVYFKTMLKSEVDTDRSLHESCWNVCEKWLKKSFDIENILKWNHNNSFMGLRNRYLVETNKEETAQSCVGDAGSLAKDASIIMVSSSSILYEIGERYDLEECVSVDKEQNMHGTENDHNARVGENVEKQNYDVDRKCDEGVIKQEPSKKNKNGNERTVAEEIADNAIENRQQCFCSPCGNGMLQKLKSLKKTGAIVSNGTLGRKFVINPCLLVDSPEKFERPLSKTLFTNWQDDTYTSLDVFAPYLVYDPSLNS